MDVFGGLFCSATFIFCHCTFSQAVVIDLETISADYVGVWNDNSLSQKSLIFSLSIFIMA